MNESFIHYVWQCQYFSKTGLLTSTGEVIQVFHPGVRNLNAGPDFLNARIQVGEIHWIGNVEIHIDASAWLQHSHDHDEGYDNVILHVVWRNDVTIRRRDGSVLPAIEIGDRVEEKLKHRYRELLNSLDVIPCADAMKRVKPVVVFSTIDKMTFTRLQSKATEVLSFVDKNRGDWSETCYQLLARNFGFKINAEPFLQLATSLPLRTLKKHADQQIQVEAMLFGVSGFIDDVEEEDEYFSLLKREYDLLRRKYRLDHKSMKRVQWKFLRLRPANFPTLRIAQFAAVICSGKDFFSAFTELPAAELKNVFRSAASPYWQRHFHFAKVSSEKNAVMGELSIDNILINTVAPVLAAYSLYRDDGRHMDKAISLLHELPPEENNISRRWHQLELHAHDAFDSQGLLELYNHYCSRRRCLDCNIGASLVKPN